MEASLENNSQECIVDVNSTPKNFQAKKELILNCLATKFKQTPIKAYAMAVVTILCVSLMVGFNFYGHNINQQSPLFQNSRKLQQTPQPLGILK